MFRILMGFMESLNGFIEDNLTLPLFRVYHHRRHHHLLIRLLLFLFLDRVLLFDTKVAMPWMLKMTKMMICLKSWSWKVTSERHQHSQAEEPLPPRPLPMMPCWLSHQLLMLLDSRLFLPPCLHSLLRPLLQLSEWICFYMSMKRNGQEHYLVMMHYFALLSLLRVLLDCRMALLLEQQQPCLAPLLFMLVWFDPFSIWVVLICYRPTFISCK